MLAIFFCLVVLLTVTLLTKLAILPRAKFLLLLSAWLILTALIAGTGILTHMEHVPPPVLLLFGGSFLLTAVLAFTTPRPSLPPITWLVGFQAFRVLVELFLAWGYHDGLVPLQMTIEGRNWDLLTGLTALPVAWLVSRNKLGARGALIWNCAGTLTLLNIVIVAILSMPLPIRQFFNDPPNTFVTGWPYVWLPAFLVQAAWLGHLLLFRKLAGGAPDKP